MKPLSRIAAVVFFAIAPGRFMDYAQWYAERSQTDGVHYVLVSATWCGPCRALKARLQSEVLPRGVDVAVLDVDADPDAAQEILHGGGIPVLLEYRRQGGKWSVRRWNGGEPLGSFFTGGK